MDVETLIKAKTHKWCPTCRGAIIRFTNDCCTTCRNAPTKPTKMVVASVKRTRSFKFAEPDPTATTRIIPSALGELPRFDDCTLWIVAAGKPETQGSMKAVGGIVKHANGPKLHEWRDSITREALRTVQGRWESLNLPVRLDVTLTVPHPATLPSWIPLETDGDDGSAPRVPPMVPPDVDKLLRAVQDALSPRDNKKKGEEVKARDRRFRLLVDDSRIVDSAATKTYPRPRHTHPWALDFPGAVIRLAPLGYDIDPMPASTLSVPADLPPQVADLTEKLRARSPHLIRT